MQVLRPPNKSVDNYTQTELTPDDIVHVMVQPVVHSSTGKQTMLVMQNPTDKLEDLLRNDRHISPKRQTAYQRKSNTWDPSAFTENGPPKHSKTNNPNEL